MKLYGSSISPLILALILMYLQLLHPSPCLSKSLETEILDLKIKAIVSVELSSMTFNELPSLFFLYENLVNKRFESINKNDQKKFEEFRKVHQYHAIKGSYYSLKIRDVFLNKMFDAEGLEIISNKINWTDNEVTKYGFLKKVTEVNPWNREFEFHESALTNFFISQYIYDNLIHPKDQPSDDEMELRLRFFFSTIADKYDLRPLTNEFIMGMIEDQNGEIFNDQVRMVMKYRFQYMFDRILPYEVEKVEKLSKVFSKDPEILKNLWRVDDNQPYFLNFFRFTTSSDKVYKLKEIAEKYFTTEPDLTNSTKLHAENIFRGKNQILTVLYRINEKRDEQFKKDILNITKYEVSDEILAKMNQEKNFLDFVDSSSYSTTEKREFYLENSESFINNARNGTNLLLIWRRLQKYFNVNELKSILIEKDKDFNYTHFFMLPSHSDQNYVETFLNLTKFYLSKDEIREVLSQRSPIDNESFIIKYISIVNDVRIFEINYNFTKDYFNHEQLLDMLFGKDPVSFIKKVTGNKAIFTFCMHLMTEYYTDDDIREMLMHTDENNTTILFWTVTSASYKKRDDVVNYLKEIFKGREDKLKELFRIRNSQKETVLGSFTRDYYSHELEPIMDLAKELFTQEEIEELQKTLN
ncbi:uncharacterized protein [Chironomus tepperi]|uniref:uncharacterized protein n=1 Tax=Chironomus tepperi TaxID=113505 RepID=UPI00391F8AE8